MKQVTRYQDWIAHHARYRPQQCALVDDARQIVVRYDELHARVDALAAGLQRQYSVGSGDRVMLLSKSSREAFELLFACARIGAIFVPVNWRLSEEEIDWMVQDCQPSVLFVEEAFARRPQGGAHHVSIALQPSLDSPYEAMLAEYRGQAPQAQAPEHEACWVILYTSGTTGRPKGAMLSYRMMHYNAWSWLGPSQITPEAVFLCSMPTFHTGGLNCYSTSVLYAGGTVVIQRDYDAQRAYALMADDAMRITHFFGTPTHYSMLTQVQGFEPGQLRHLRIAGMGGSPSSNALLTGLLASGLPMQPAYGMTEIGPAICVTEMPDVLRKAGSCGHPTMHVEMKVSHDDGTPCAPGERGELRVRGAVCMSGYWNRPDATEQAFHDGWFCTGDGAYMDEDGYVFIVDRLKDMFISGGENVYPAEVERVLGDHAAVLLSAVIGVSDERWGECGEAYVVLKRDMAASEDDLVAHCRERLARFKVPKRVVIVESLPTNASGKILKRAIRRMVSCEDSRTGSS